LYVEVLQKKGHKMKDLENRAYVAQSTARPLYLLPGMMNRHGLIAGATGTGKTVSLQVVAETLSQLGIPVFMTDVKGDLSGIARAGGDNPKVADRVETLHLARQGFRYQAFPVCFWDVFGEQGHPLRSAISQMGPLLLSRLMGLSDAQSGVLSLAFKIADDNGWLLIDMKDLRAMLKYVGDHRAGLITTYGHITTASTGSIQRALLQLEEQGGASWFGEPAFRISHLLQRDVSGQGMIHILSADKLMQSPRIYSTLLLWLLSELFEQLPEVGDVDLPKLVFFFDEAHLLFNDAPKVLLEKIEQVVRLIRSRGVGIYFVTQNPADIPDTVLGQLGHRIQHALRAYTPRDWKAVKTAAQTFSINPAVNVEREITELAVGEALVSFLDDQGRPVPVERAVILPPQSRTGALAPEERTRFIRRSPFYGMYEQAIDRESAYEILTKASAEQVVRQATPVKQSQQAEEHPQGAVKRSRTPHTSSRRRASESTAGNLLGDLFGDVARQTQRSLTRNIGNRIGRQIVRGILGGIFGGR
jgi:DNA helicase HerA-like ATPase